jgi:hypothetical protein
MTRVRFARFPSEIIGLMTVSGSEMRMTGIYKTVHSRTITEHIRETVVRRKKAAT